VYENWPRLLQMLAATGRHSERSGRRLNEYHSAMNIDDGRVLASSGVTLADGEFQLEGAEGLECLIPADAMVAVRSRPGLWPTEFAPVGNARRDTDGLWSADWPVHLFAFQTTVPPLDELLDYPSFALACRMSVELVASVGGANLPRSWRYFLRRE